MGGHAQFVLRKGQELLIVIVVASTRGRQAAMKEKKRAAKVRSMRKGK
jgi:hypothetical protein